MPVYLGSLGRLVKLPYVGSQQVQAEERYNFSSTLEGKRKAQVKPKGPRTWDLSADHYRPNEHSLLSQFANGAWGNGPFVFVSADAPVSNMLTPAAASCDPALVNGATNSAGGPMLTPDGWAGRSYMNSDPAKLLWFGTGHTPVIPGMRVTVSAYLLGNGAAVRIYFYDATGVSLPSSTSTVSATAGTVVRSHVTREPPPGAVSCRVLAVNAIQGTRPAITWTPTLLDWADGQGCEKAVVHGVTRDQVLAVAGNTYSNLSFTVSEVG